MFTRKMHDLGNSELYQYDNRDRLTNFSRGTLNSGNTEIAVLTNSPFLIQERDWTLDYLGNWLEVNKTWQGQPIIDIRTPNIINEYVLVDGIQHYYDKNGNLINDGERMYFYDVGNRLIRIEKIE